MTAGYTMTTSADDMTGSESRGRIQSPSDDGEAQAETM
jgi:hypothetical protein